MEREEKFEIVRNSKIRMEKLKKISGYLRDEIEIKYPELIKEDVETLISLLKLELDMAFKYEKRIKTLISNNFCKYYNYFSFSHYYFNFNS